jgi:hypothetical protein
LRGKQAGYGSGDKKGGVRIMVRKLGLSRLMVYELLEEGGIRISEILP